MVKDPFYLYTPQEITAMLAGGNHVYGGAKRFIVHNTVPPVDKLKGESGEQAIAGLLNLWTVPSEGYVFHSLGTHDGTPGETDHVAYRNNVIVVVETKTFSGYSSIKVTKHGTVFGVKEDREHKLADNKLARKVELYQRRFPHSTVKGLLVVASYGVVFTTEHSSYSACGLDDFHAVITRLTEGTPPDLKASRSVIEFFARLCLKS